LLRETVAPRRAICYLAPMFRSELRVNGVDLIADLSGALWWPARATLVVADLHLEKGSSFAAAGSLLPPYDTDATLDRLGAAITRLAPARVIALGDSFHDGDAASRIAPATAARLGALVGATEWIWIAGNHDPSPAGPWGGAVRDELTEGALRFRHAADQAAPHGEVSGHFHPKATLQLRARRLSARCFVTDGRRLVLPAFGAYAGGLDVFAPPLRALFRGGFEAFLLGPSRVIAVGHERLQRKPDRSPTFAPAG
jgi:DNA ligase-associated metallophosphoesterase